MSRAATLLSVVIAEALFDAYFVKQPAFEIMYESATKAELDAILNAKGKRVQKPVTFFMPLAQLLADPVTRDAYEDIGRFTDVLATRLTNVFPGSCSRRALAKTPFLVRSADKKPEEVVSNYIGFDYKTAGFSLKNVASKAVWKSVGETFSKDLDDAWVISQTLKPIVHGQMNDQNVDELGLTNMIAWFNDRYITDTYFQFLIRVARFHPQPQLRDMAKDGLMQIFGNRNAAGRKQISGFTQHLLNASEEQGIADAIQPLQELLHAFESLGTKPGNNDWTFVVTSDLPSHKEQHELNRMSGTGRGAAT